VRENEGEASEDVKRGKTNEFKKLEGFSLRRASRFE